MLDILNLYFISSSAHSLIFFTVFLRSQRLNFDVSSPNGILLFREASKMICTYGEYPFPYLSVQYNFICLEERKMLVILFFWACISMWIWEVGNRSAESQVAVMLEEEASCLCLQIIPNQLDEFLLEKCDVSKERKYTRILKAHSKFRSTESYIREFAVLSQGMLKPVCRWICGNILVKHSKYCITRNFWDLYS